MMKKVLILCDKNNRRAFDVSSRGQFEKVALSILVRRSQGNWYPCPDPRALGASESQRKHREGERYEILVVKGSMR